MYDSQSNLPEYTSWPAIINFFKYELQRIW